MASVNVTYSDFSSESISSIEVVTDDTVINLEKESKKTILSLTDGDGNQISATLSKDALIALIKGLSMIRNEIVATSTTYKICSSSDEDDDDEDAV